MQTRSQQYAKAAYPRVDAIKNKPEEKKYGALALNFPVMVLQSGLAQATGFVLAKGKYEHLKYLDDLAAVLGEGHGTAFQGKIIDSNPAEQLEALKLRCKAFHGKIIDSNLTDYQHLTRRTLDAAGWFKRYAQGILGAKTTDGEPS
ncbi:type III-B CRISPR module-associated protein Cmr5 [Propionivibrio sp.]|uniref:type III-B CRISPR module-associated protein Cmr5 n=1 Tax=Propionivibrio sp. TaxID=2212460 RepID=UPI003BF3FD5A